MSETFEKVLVKDDRLGCISSKVKFQVLKGGQNITSQPFKAISETKSSHVYNVTVPSLETIISREVLWKSRVTLKITNATKADAEFCVNYGVTDALAPFPLHSLVSTMTATINNNTISQNMMDTLPIVLRMVDPEEFAKYDSMTPTALDYLADYKDGVHRMEGVPTRRKQHNRDAIHSIRDRRLKHSPSKLRVAPQQHPQPRYEPPSWLSLLP